MTPLWSNSHTTAKDQRVGGITGVIEDCTIHGGDTYLIAIILHTRHHARLDPAWVQHPLRKLLDGVVLWTEAQHVRGCNRLRGYTQNIPDHTADACVGSTKWLNGGRVVVGFHLE